MSKPVVWSEWAKLDIIEIKQFYDRRNRSKTYGKKLLQVFKRRAKLIETHPLISRSTSLDGVRAALVLEFTMFYEFKDEHILILMVWDNRRSPEQMESMLDKRLRKPI